MHGSQDDDPPRTALVATHHTCLQVRSESSREEMLTDTRSWDMLGPAPATVEKLLSRLLMAPPVRLLRRAWSENLDVWEFMTLPVLLAGLRMLLAVKLGAVKEAG